MTISRNLRYALTMVSITLLLYGCGGKSNVSDSDIIGKWIATEHGGQQIESGSEYQYTLTFNSDHHFIYSMLRRGEQKEFSYGEWDLYHDHDGTKLNASIISGETPYTIEISRNIMTLIDRDNKERSVWKHSK